VFQRYTSAALSVIIAVISGVSANSALAAPTPTTRVIAIEGDGAPDGDGSLTDFIGPAVGDSGHAATRGFLAGTSHDSGIFRGDGVNLVQIAREGQAAPDGDGGFASFNNPFLNGANEAAFLADLTNTSHDTGIFRGDGNTLTRIVREGQNAPDNVGTFSSFSDLSFNNTGQVGFRGEIIGSGVDYTNNRGVFYADGNTVTRIARGGEAAPSNGTFRDFFSPAINNNGQAAFSGFLVNTTAGNSAVFRGDGSTTNQLAREGQSAPNGDGSFTGFFTEIAINDAGQVMFRTQLDNTSHPNAIYRSNGSMLTRLARTGDTTPNNDGSFFGLSNAALNNTGQAIFHATLTGTTQGIGLFRSDGATLTEIAREGQTTADINGGFSEFFPPAINDSGQAAFSALLTGPGVTSSSNLGVFFYDDALGLLEVAREGDAFLGSTITALSFNNGVGANSNELSGLSAHGDVGYSFQLADGRVPAPERRALLAAGHHHGAHPGREGIAVWGVPEPASAAVLGLGALLLLPRRRRGADWSIR